MASRRGGVTLLQRSWRGAMVRRNLRAKNFYINVVLFVITFVKALKALDDFIDPLSVFTIDYLG
jgi:hypothetical protein